MRPQYVLLLDVRTEPRRDAMTKLIMCMDANPQLGGVCGEIAVKKPKVFSMLEAAQAFEYKISHVMDKGAPGALP